MKERVVTVVGFVLVVNSVLLGFDVEKYVSDQTDFILEVERLKTKILSLEPSSDPGFFKDLNLLHEVLRGTLSRPAVAKVVLDVVVLDARIGHAFCLSREKCSVIVELLKKRVNADLVRCGISVVDAQGINAPLLTIAVAVTEKQVGTLSMSEVRITIASEKVVTDPVTNLKILTTDWSNTVTEVSASGMDVETTILSEAEDQIGSFLSEQYQRCIRREVMHQLKKESKLPAWLKAEANMQEQKTPDERKARK